MADTKKADPTVKQPSTAGDPEVKPHAKEAAVKSTGDPEVKPAGDPEVKPKLAQPA